jgi:alkylation response protein AidB-like acyl-CoA dehydrogenase
LASAIALGPQIAAEAAETERRRRISADLLAAIKGAGLMRMWLPHEVGGSASDLATILQVYEEVARHDGSTGWVTMIGSGTNFLFTALAPASVHAIFGPDPDIVTGGFFAPRGLATPVEGGYRISGRWSFASGCEHCDWMLGGCTAHDANGPILDEEGRAQLRMMVFRREDAIIHDTWNTAGLRGTGSHDYEVEGLFVPNEYTFNLGVDRPDFSFAHAGLPLFSTLASCLGATTLGIARGALDALIDHARTRRFREGHVKDLPLIRTRVAEAEAQLRAARAFLFDRVERVWALAAADREIPTREGVLLRLAATHAVRTSAEVARSMFESGGVAALYEGSPLQRCMRDALAAQQHVMTAFHSFEGLGRALLDEGQEG